MGFFSNTRAALDLANAADEINNCFLSGLIPYLDKYAPGQSYSIQDRGYIRAGVEFIESKIVFMQNRLQDLDSSKWMYTMVRTADGHSTAVPGYIAAMKQLCMEVRKGL